MSEELLERFIKQYIEAQTSPYIQFKWHGGEALLRPILFYQKAIRWQQQYGKGRHIDNSYRPTEPSLQRNGQSFCTKTIGLWESA